MCKALYTLRGILRQDAAAITLVDRALAELLAGRTPTLPLSVRQPHAEAVVRGVKKIDYRSGPIRLRGRVLIYAGLGRYSAADEDEMMAAGTSSPTIRSLPPAWRQTGLTRQAAWPLRGRSLADGSRRCQYRSSTL